MTHACALASRVDVACPDGHVGLSSCRDTQERRATGTCSIAALRSPRMARTGRPGMSAQAMQHAITDDGHHPARYLGGVVGEVQPSPIQPRHVAHALVEAVLL